MSNTMAVNDSSIGKAFSNKVISIGLAVFSVIEAVVTYFLVINPLYISPVYNNTELIERGITYSVKLFGKTFASAEELAANQVILSLSDTIISIVLVYIVITGIPLLLSLFFYKGYAFAKSYLTAVFGGKAIIGMVPTLIPFSNLYFRTSIKIFGIADALICLAITIFFVYLNSIEYADDMLLSADGINAMKKRSVKGSIMFAMMAVLVVCESFAMGAYGSSYSLYLGWNDQQVTQGTVLILLLGVALLASIMYIRDAEWTCYFYLGLGAAAAITNIVAVISKVIWIFGEYMPNKSLANSGDATAQEWIGSNGMSTTWWKNTIFLVICLVVSVVLTIYAFNQSKSKICVKPSADDMKAAKCVYIGAGSILLNFILTIAAITVWDMQRVGASFALGAMDFMYFVVYGGATLFLVLALLGGYSFTKFGALGLFVVVNACNFESVFTVFSTRSSVVASNPGYIGYNYIIAGVLYILAIVSCLGIIALFAVKDVDNYLYNKRYS